MDRKCEACDLNTGLMTCEHCGGKTILRLWLEPIHLGLPVLMSMAALPVFALEGLALKRRAKLDPFDRSRGQYARNELADMARSAVNLPAGRYFKAAMGHRFCLAAPGDFVSTPKITEYVAMGAAGGCLPLLVLDGPAAGTLPSISSPSPPSAIAADTGGIAVASVA